MKTVLLIDDEYVVLAMLEDVLAARGYRVITANQAGAGVQAALTGRPDLIFLDIILPERDGFSVLSDLKRGERTRHIPVIFMSALSDSRTLNAEGVVASIRKPIEQDRVLALVESVIGPP